jgi:pilus assembly protein CpaB
MNRRRLLFIGILALTLGALVAFKVYRSLQAKIMPATVGVDVLVASNNIAVGAKLEEHDLKVVKVPPEAVPPDAFHTKARAVGRGVVLPIGRGDFVLPYKLAPENAGSSASSLIPFRMRAVSINVNEVTGVAGFVEPGTRVDVLFTATVNVAGLHEPRSTTILQNVPVLASDQRLDRSAPRQGQAAHVVTLLVSLEDAERLALAMQEGRIQLVLRNSVDTNQETPAPVWNTNLYGGTATPTPEQSKVTRTKRTPMNAPEPPQCCDIDILRGPQKETIHLKP